MYTKLELHIELQSHVFFSKPDRYHGINKKKDTNELIYKTE